jgi:uncharacterized protein YndB with AHSA1/START domain
MSRTIAAPPAAVFAALLDPAAVAHWRVPDDMTAVVHEFEPTVGGRFRVSLAYSDAARTGKTAGNVDTYHGTFVVIEVPHRVVERIVFESAEAELREPMTMTTTVEAADVGSRVTVEHEGLPSGVSAEDNETGTRMALAKLAELLEQPR